MYTSPLAAACCLLAKPARGKTFAMLRLMQQLLDRSKGRPSAPLPVYLNLASWSPLSSRRWIDNRSRWRGGWLGLVIGPACGAFLWGLFGPARGLAFGFMITLFVCMFSGFLGTGVRVSLEPNQGILRSCRHAMITTSLFTFGSVTACAVAYGAVHGFWAAVVNGTLGFSALIALLTFGAIPVVRHVCLGTRAPQAGSVANVVELVPVDTDRPVSGRHGTLQDSSPDGQWLLVSPRSDSRLLCSAVARAIRT